MTEGVMLYSAAYQCQSFSNTIFRIMVGALCTSEMATSNKTSHSKGVIPIFSVVRQASLRRTAAVAADYSKPRVGK